MGVILITHDLGLAATHSATTIHVMYAGRIVERSAGRAALRQARCIPYTEALLGAICRLDEDVDAADRRDRRTAAPPAGSSRRAAPSTRAARMRSTCATTETPGRSAS